MKPASWSTYKKCAKVISSCRTLEQLRIARKYVSLAANAGHLSPSCHKSLMDLIQLTHNFIRKRMVCNHN